jgi:hypothetical protein
MSSLDKHLASYPCTAAGSRALAGHLRDDHGKAVYTSPYEDHAARCAMHAAAHEAGQRGLLPARDAAGRPHPPRSPAPAGTEPAGDGSPGTAGHEHAWGCASPQHGPDATYRCGCGETAPGSEIGVTEQARDWFYTPAGQRQDRVTTRGRLPGYRRHNSAAVRALARHLRGEGFQSVDIDPGDPGAADLHAAWDATEGQATGTGKGSALLRAGHGLPSGTVGGEQ